ncbi:MAG: response regulator, partial [Calditrichia bacterium]
QKAAEKSPGKTTPAIKGNLAEKQLVDILKFCESNSLNGKVVVEKGDERGELEYEKGVLQTVKLGDKVEDEALDIMLNWEEGNFLIEPRPFELENTETVFAAQEDESYRVVIVNNSLVVQKLLQRAFEGLGYEVYSVDTATKGQRLVNSLKPNLVISDTKPPDAGGVEFVHALREKSDVPIILLTDSANRDSFSEQLSGVENVAFTNSVEVGEVLKIVEQTLT